MAIKPFTLYFNDTSAFKLSDLEGLQDFGDGVKLCNELDVSQMEFKDLTHFPKKKDGSPRVDSDGNLVSVRRPAIYSHTLLLL